MCSDGLLTSSTRKGQQMINDKRRREVSKRMREYDVSEFKESAIVPFLDCLGVGYLNWREVLDSLADLIDRPMCHDLVEHKQDPFIPGKRMTDGYFHCSNCDWSGQLWEYIGFGDMLAYEPVHCPKCGEKIER